MKLPSALTIPIVALALLPLCGCKPTLTREPFGVRETTSDGDKVKLAGNWVSPSRDEKAPASLNIAFGPGADDIRLVVRSDKGSQTYEARVYTVKTGVRGSPETVVFFRPAGSDKPWRFVWPGMAANSDEMTGPVLLFHFPDEESFQALGVALEKPAKFDDYDLFSEGGAILLTAKPEAILAALQGKDLRTFMHATSPYVFLRDRSAKNAAAPEPQKGVAPAH